MEVVIQPCSYFSVGCLEEAFDPNTKYILLVLEKSGEGPGNKADGE